MIFPIFYGIFMIFHDLSNFPMGFLFGCRNVQVEPSVRRCLRTWLGDREAQRRIYGDLDEAARSAALRRQAVQILGFPEEFCLEEEPFGMGIWHGKIWENHGKSMGKHS